MKKLKIEISTSSLTPKFRKELIHIIQEHQGDVHLSIFLKDVKTGHRIEFDSKKYQVSDSVELKKSLEQIGIEIVSE